MIVLKNLGRLTMLLGLVMLVASPLAAADKPQFDFDWYGYVKLDASYDQNLTSHGNFAMWVQPQNGDQDDEQFNMTHKQSRFGMKAIGQGYQNAKVAGQLEFDLYGAGGAENKALLLLRHAFFTVDAGSFQLLAGQTWDLVAPLNPATLNYPVLWGCGNPGYRRPQVRFTYTAAPNDQTNVKMACGFFRTIGSDLTPTLSLATEVSDGSDDGTDAGIPTLQGLLDVTHKLSNGGSIRAGVSGLWGQLKAEGSLGTDETYQSQGVAGHLAVAINKQVGFAGEFFTGSNLGGYNAGINNSDRVDGVHAKGGWGYLWVKPTAKVTLAAGGGMDDPDDADLSTGNRGKNQAFFGNVNFSPIPLVTLGFELSQWETSYVGADVAKAMRAQTSFILNF
ncbi:MAG: hypothetical protein ABIE70_03290 [bacterium]